ncbi:MAG: polysaccharide pyruvyl transferase family protein [Lachnospiraceae bacterium]|nr:polysaccharide pyruvyl transferase family protein [Lachnospiraceae bacterium]
MNIAVITRHAITNYGSLLQAFATQKVIEDLGHNCEIIDYVRDDESYFKHEVTLLKRKSDWYNNVFKRIIYLALRQPESILAGRKFAKEQKKYLKLTKRYTSEQQLKENKPKADAYITGSDQVWGPVADGTYDSVYCLSFTNDADRRLAYAASFGRTEMTQELEAYYYNWLKKYESVAVREDSAVELLSKMDIYAKQVLDPTLLLDSKFWDKYLMPIKHEKYVLVYQLHNDKKLGEYAKKVAEIKGLPLIRISASLHQISRSGKFVWCPKIGEFLSYIKNAECMITDSFHGTAFAINFNTPFVEVLPNNNTGTRNMSILKLTGLSGRILKNDEDVYLASEKVDFTYANKVIEKRREESKAVLARMIQLNK